MSVKVNVEPIIPPCQECGRCCAMLPKWAEVREDEAGRIGLPLLQSGDVEPYAMRTIGPDNRCVTLEGEIGGKCRCTIYDRKPDVCDYVQRGSPICMYALGWHHTDLWSTNVD